MGLSQEKFGELFAKTKGNVSAWENGRHSPSIDQVMRMSELSGLPIPGSVRANVGPARVRRNGRGHVPNDEVAPPAPHHPAPALSGLFFYGVKV